MSKSLRFLRRLYLISTMLLVVVLYLALGGARRGDPLLALEALFAWLAVFVPPLFILERSWALARLIFRRASSPAAVHRRG